MINKVILIGRLMKDPEIKIMAGLAVDVYSGHIIIKARGFEFPIYGKDFHKLQKALEEASK